MTKPIYGLKDAPRAWSKKLSQILQMWGMKASIADPQIYLAHHQTGTSRKGSASNETASLKMILSTHVDDLKGVNYSAGAFINFSF